MDATHPTEPVVELRAVRVVRDGLAIVDDVSLSISRGERWVVLGPNGCGKTTLLRVLALRDHPSSGSVLVQGRPMGTFDVRGVRPHIAHASAALSAELRPDLPVLDCVMSAINGALETWWHPYTEADAARASLALSRAGMRGYEHRALSSLSSGELQRVVLARALVVDPWIVLLDEPSARLDLGGRETLVRILDDFASTHPELPTVTVTHHVDEIPVTTTHCALMRGGRLLAAGPLGATLHSDSLSDCFGTALVLETRPNGRLTAYSS